LTDASRHIPAPRFQLLAAFSDREKVKSAAAQFAAVPVVGSGFAALLMLYAATYHEDSGAAKSVSSIALALIGAAVVATLLACAAVYSILRARPHHARIALGLHAAIAAGVLLVLLRSSRHSDGKLVAFTVGIELCTLIAFCLSSTLVRRSLNDDLGQSYEPS
jgi:hypothetical protein